MKPWTCTVFRNSVVTRIVADRCTSLVKTGYLGTVPRQPHFNTTMQYRPQPPVLDGNGQRAPPLTVTWLPATVNRQTDRQTDRQTNKATIQEVIIIVGHPVVWNIRDGFHLERPIMSHTYYTLAKLSLIQQQLSFSYFEFKIHLIYLIRRQKIM